MTDGLVCGVNGPHGTDVDLLVGMSGSLYVQETVFLTRT